MSKETQNRNRELLLYIRKGLSIKEGFLLCSEGYESLLEKTNNILEFNNKKMFSDIPKEHLKYLIGKAKEINNKIKKWQGQIDFKIKKNPEKYLPQYFAKWYGINYLYSMPYLYKTKFIYNIYQTDGMKISHFINNYLNNIKEVDKLTNEARRKLINSNKALIYQQAIKVAGSRTDIIEDLVSVAHYQFIQCMDRTFDLNRGLEFSTYVTSCMIHKCKEAKIKYDEIIRIPTERIKEKTLAAKGELDLNAEDIENDKKRVKESIIRNTISNSNMYWSLDNLINDEDGDNDYFVSDKNSMEEITNSIVLKETINRIKTKILSKNKGNKLIKIKALEYSGLLDFENNFGKRTLSEVATFLFQNGYTESVLTKERVRQLVNDGKKLVKKQILLDRDLSETLGINEMERE